MTDARPDASQMPKVIFRDMTAKAAQELGYRRR